MTDLLGWSPAQVATADEERWDTLHVDLHRWRQVLLSEGVAAAFRHLSAGTSLAQRLLTEPDGDRRMTDLAHVAELLHAHAAREVGGTAGLVSWIESSMADAAVATTPTPPEHLTTRLERAGDVVQIMTVHGAKGLEHGIVLAPFLWDTVGRTPSAMQVHDATVGRRRLDVGAAKTHRTTSASPTCTGSRPRRRNGVWPTWRQPGPSTISGCGGHPRTGRRGHRLAPCWPDPDRRRRPPRPSRRSRGCGRPTGTVRLQHGRCVCSRCRHSPCRPVGGAVDLGGVRQDDRRRVAPDVLQPAGGGRRPPRTPGRGATPTLDTTATPSVAGDEPAGALLPSAPPDPRLDAVVPLQRMRGGADVGTTLHAVLEHIDFTGEGRHRTRHSTTVPGRPHPVAAGQSSPRRTRRPVTTRPWGGSRRGGCHAPHAPGRRSRRGRDPIRRHRAGINGVDEMAFELPVLA